MNVVGLDLSLTATGVALPDGTRTLDPAPRRGMDRILWLREQIGTACLMGRTDLVVIEDYAFSRAAAHAHELGELGGCVKAALINHGIGYVLVGPSSLKKYATGKGNADKTAMALAAFKRAGIEFGDNNQCDAWWLRAMALDALGSPLFDLPAEQRKAMSGIDWPAAFARTPADTDEVST